jgi:glycosyltransferase involved in cell wall biosynthesis
MASFVIYCPDRHLTYRGDTPETTGVGGGVTARIHLSRAMARRGHDVEVVVNTPDTHEVDGARFIPLSEADSLTADIVVLNSSGGALSVEPASDLPIEGGRLILWVHGVSPIGGLGEFTFDEVIVPSQFVARVVGDGWGTGAATVIPNGFQRYSGDVHVKRDPYRLAYTSHPTKGLHATLAVLERLRRTDERFNLHLYGGAALWGEASSPIIADGVTDHGMVTQPEIARGLREASFALHLQSIEEAYSISVSEAMAAGAIVVASPVGALAERIQSGKNGILAPGDHQSAETADQAAEAILRLLRKPHRAEKIRRRAIEGVVDWDDVAAMWERLLDG